MGRDSQRNQDSPLQIEFRYHQWIAIQSQALVGLFQSICLLKTNVCAVVVARADPLHFAHYYSSHFSVTVNIHQERSYRLYLDIPDPTPHY